MDKQELTVTESLRGSGVRFPRLRTLLVHAGIGLIRFSIPDVFIFLAVTPRDAAQAPSPRAPRTAATPHGGYL